jgi:predicted metal-dependent hydrolase
VLPNPDEEDVKSAIKRNQQLIQEQDARYQKRKVEKELAQEKARARQLAISKRCKISRNRLVLLKQRGVITIVDFGGNLHQPSDEQREQMIKGIEAFIEENCQ